MTWNGKEEAIVSEGTRKITGCLQGSSLAHGGLLYNYLLTYANFYNFFPCINHIGKTRGELKQIWLIICSQSWRIYVTSLIILLYKLWGFFFSKLLCQVNKAKQKSGHYGILYSICIKFKKMQRNLEWQKVDQ